MKPDAINKHEKEVISVENYISTTVKTFLGTEKDPNKRRPNHIWKTVCASLLEQYPINHQAWGHEETKGAFGICNPSLFRQLFQWESNEKHQSLGYQQISYRLVKMFGTRTLRTWREISNTAYIIAKMSSETDRLPSPISEALRGLHISHESRKRNEISWENLGICDYCWRLAPISQGKIRIIEYKGKTFLRFYKSICDKHHRKDYDYDKPHRLRRNGIYLKAHRFLPEVTALLKKTVSEASLPKNSKKRDLVNRVFPLSDNIKADLSPETLKQLEIFYPLTFNYIREQGKEPTNFRELVEALVSDSADNENNKVGVNAIKEEIESIITQPSLISGHIEYCEVWQYVYTKHPHGGKRNGTGRPSKK